MIKFDLAAFEKHKKNDSTYCKFTTVNSDGYTIETCIKENKDSYQETITYLERPIKKRCMYDKKTLYMTKEIKTFYDCIIGFRKDFTEDGELINLTDNDKPFLFSWQNLVLKMKSEFDIDLMDIKKYDGEDDHKPKVSRSLQQMRYYVSIPNDFVPYGIFEEKFEIDATTGKLLYHSGKSNKSKNIQYY